jgi:hypothetical protein
VELSFSNIVGLRALDRAFVIRNGNIDKQFVQFSFSQECTWRVANNYSLINYKN